MDNYHFRILEKYNKAANEKMNAHIKDLSEEEWNKTFSGYFASIHELCSHIFIADFNWLCRFKALRTFNSLNGGYFGKQYSFQETLFENRTEYFSKRTELDVHIGAFIDELQEDDLRKILRYVSSRGETFEKTMEGLLLHMFNHEAHHRGMISLYLEMLGKENDFNNILAVV